MKRWIFAALAWLIAGLSPALAVEFKIASRAEASAAATARDEYLAILTPADRSLKTRTPEAPAKAVLIAQMGEGVDAFTPEETARLEALFARHADAVARLSSWLPQTVFLAKSTAKLEAGAPHTRGATIFMGRGLPSSDAELDGLFFHELFHVLSRHNPNAHDALYRVIGFEPCRNAPAPRAVRARVISNPDAPFMRHVLTVSLGGAERTLLPVLYADPARYDAAKGGTFFNYAKLRFMEVTRAADGRCRVVREGDAPRFFSAEEATPAILARIGPNTRYLFHAEEAMADNFSLLMTDRAGAKDQAVLDRLAAVLAAGPPPR